MIAVRILLYIWQLPQNLLGLIVSRRRLCESVYDGIKVYYMPRLFRSGVSLGQYIILDNRLNYNWNVLKHEWGHTRQSQYLGWLYLPVIGLPSLCGNILSRIFNWDSKKYYAQPWEK